MAREIRITIDDEEVFERMKARKGELELSWEDVLHRGLRRREVTESRDPVGTHERNSARSPRYERPRDPLSDPTGFADDLKRQIQDQFRQSLHASLAADPDIGTIDDDVATLETAEDAVLLFEFLGDGTRSRQNQVPLRVNLEASAGGLDVDVVSVREGKTVTDMNAFEAKIRKRVIEGLAAGNDATLSLDGGAETYPVSPALSWSRVDGVPAVSSVTIDEVQFDDS